MTRTVSPLTWRNLVLASAIGYSPATEPAPGDEPPHIPGEPGREEPGRLWECHGIDREPIDLACPECAAEAAKALQCRWCGEACEPEEERCCGRSVCMSAERSERRGS